MTSRVVFHLPKRFLVSYKDQPHLQIFQRIDQIMALRGGTVETRARHLALRDQDRGDWSDILEPENLHIVENGTVRQRGVLNATLAYLPPYYHLDPHGVLAQSSAGASPNGMADMDADAVLRFWDHLQNRFVQDKYSRYGEPSDDQDIPDGCIAVFLQGKIPMQRGTAFCDNEALLRTVAKHAGGRPVVVKAHPISNVKAESELIHRLLSEGIDLVPTDANIHDILPRSVATVSYNSAVAIEGFLYQKPAILFGKSDFHHLCETVEDGDHFPDALIRALKKRPDYKRYLYWYFTTHCVHAHDIAAETKIIDIFAAQGFGATQLGLRPLPRGFHIPTNDRWVAADLMQQYLTSQPDIETVGTLIPIKVKPSSWVLTGQLNGRDVAIKRYFNGDLVQKVHDMKGEVDRMAQVLGDGDCQVNTCLMAWPDDGIVLLSHAAGDRLDRAIAGLSGATRAKVVAHAGRWLKAYTDDRKRRTTFAPLFWVKRLRQRSLAHVQSGSDRVLIAKLIDKLHAAAPTLRGCPVAQAASHGDFAGINAHFDGSTITGVDIQGECWIAVAREAARFLVWQQLHDDTQHEDRVFGINRADVAAFLSSGILDSGEITSTFPFFIGEQLCSRFIEDHSRRDVRDKAKAAVKAYLNEDWPDEK